VITSVAQLDGVTPGGRKLLREAEVEEEPRIVVVLGDDFAARVEDPNQGIGILTEP